MSGCFGVGSNTSHTSFGSGFDFKNTSVEHTREATVTRETDMFGRPTKTTIDAGKGNDYINPHTNADGSVDVYVNGEKHSFTAEEAKNLVVLGGKGKDTIVCTGETAKFEFLGMNFGPAAPKMTLDGGKGDDTIVGSEGNDTIRGGKGNDLIMGAGGHDNIEGGRGSDQIWGGDGNDTIHGGKGKDTIHGGRGDDNCYGDGGRDKVYGNSGRDWVQGGSTQRNFIEDIFKMPSQTDSVEEKPRLPSWLAFLSRV
jgi:Ca2+-binding RTX toxin-like protein